MRVIAVITCVITSLLLLEVDDVMCRRVPPREAVDCYQKCFCSETDCHKGVGENYCNEFQVKCINSNVTKDLSVLPSNITRLSITGEYMGHSTLDIFTRFVYLKKLALVGNTIRSLKITKPLKFLNFLNLDKNRLCFLPTKNMTFGLPSLKMMKVRYNNLTFIDAIHFPSKLIDLDLSHNHIESPIKGSFRRLSRLHFLRLENNSITELFPRAYRHLVNLQSLILDHNQISLILANSFITLPSVSVVSMRNNLIDHIEKGAFKKIGIRWHGQHEIRLENNRIKFLEEDAIEILYPRRNYYSIYLAGNPLFCDCDMMLLRDKAGYLLRDSNRVMCASRTEVTLQELHIPGCKADYYSDDEYYEDDEYYY